MAEVKCAQPGCGGTIEDGYCDVCGLAAAPAQLAVSYAGGVTGRDPVSQGSRSASAGASGGSAASGSASASSTSSSRTSSSTSRGTASRGPATRGTLGAGLVTIPPVLARDPAAAVLADPKIAENRRFCGSCGELVGQSRDGRPGVTEGFCRHCGTRFSFSPKLQPGELVAGQYEVAGCLAHGGLGWVYLARDKNVSDRWVVLKGLLNTGDADAMAAAVAERQFLARIEHPHIVRIYNFVQHASQVDGESAGYIVMEYVGGKSLKQIRLEARQQGTAVPLAHALAYTLEILGAFGYLHDRGLVYCDFKPDNVIQHEEQLKLIDMGGVRAIDDDGAIYGTVGFQAPEIAAEGPSPSSDLYTIGRTLAVLTFDFTGFQREYEFGLPPDVPLLKEQESFARLLRRATHPDPGRRFQSAGEMAEQVTGVLREVLAAVDGEPRPAFSGLFSPELRAVGTGLTPAAAPPPAAEVVAGLPVPLVDPADPAAGFLATLAGLPPGEQAAALRGAVGGTAGVPAAVAESTQLRLALARALILAGDKDAAAIQLAELAATGPATALGDWRITWHTGLCELAGGRPESARTAFDTVCDALPGELAPKLALAFATEACGEQAAARRCFQVVAATDRSYLSAAFGLARTALAAGDRPAAIAAVAAVPQTSSHYAAAQVAAVRLLLAADGQSAAADLRAAGKLAESIALDDIRRQQLTVQVLGAVLDWLTALPGDADRQAARGTVGPVLGCEAAERDLRFGLERGYRALATLATDPARRIALVDAANRVRPQTWS